MSYKPDRKKRMKAWSEGEDEAIREVEKAEKDGNQNSRDRWNFRNSSGSINLVSGTADRRMPF